MRRVLIVWIALKCILLLLLQICGMKDEQLMTVGIAEGQGRLIQWARWARAQGPQASGGPQTANALFFSSREFCHWLNK